MFGGGWRSPWVKGMFIPLPWVESQLALWVSRIHASYTAVANPVTRQPGVNHWGGRMQHRRACSHSFALLDPEPCIEPLSLIGVAMTCFLSSLIVKPIPLPRRRGQMFPWEASGLASIDDAAVNMFTESEPHPRSNYWKKCQSFSELCSLCCFFIIESSKGTFWLLWRGKTFSLHFEQLHEKMEMK